MAGKGVDWDKQVAQEMVKAGFRALSLKHHPDKGGKHDYFLKLEPTREHLEALLNGARTTFHKEDPTGDARRAWEQAKRNTQQEKKQYQHDDPAVPPNMFRYAVGWWFIADVEVVRESEKAIQFKCKGSHDLFWLPKSQLHRTANKVWGEEDEGDVVFSEWIARQKGWV